MYSRYQNRPSTPIQLPENYSGVAFSERMPPKSEKTAAHTLEIAKPSPPPTEQPPQETISAKPPKTETPPSPTASDEEHASAQAETHNQERESVAASGMIPKPFDGLFGHMGNTFPFSHGLGFEELLIIGLIILLSRNEEGSDMVLWLALLLFCG